jgi:hypothetical protein
MTQHNTLTWREVAVLAMTFVLGFVVGKLIMLVLQ